MDLKKNKKIIIIVVIIIIVAVAVFAYFTFFKDTFKKKIQAPESDLDKSGKKINWTPSNGFPLKKGSSGNYVKQLQAGLNIVKKENLSIDGKFGEKTLASLNKHYGVSELSQADYDRYIKPNLVKINDYINDFNAGRLSSQTPKASTPSLIDRVNNVFNPDLTGKSIEANDNVRGFLAKADSDLEYVMDTDEPINYNPGQYVGIVEKIDNGWVRALRTNGSRVFIQKSQIRVV